MTGLASLASSATGGGSTTPESVMSSRRISSPQIKTVNRNLFFYMKFNFYKFDRNVAYSINNDLRPTNYGSTQTNNSLLPQNLANQAGNALNNATRGQTATAARQQTEERTAYNRTQLTQPLSTVILPLPRELYEEYAVDFQQAGLGLINRTVLDSFVNGHLAVGDLEEAMGRATTSGIGVLIEALPENLRAAAEIARGKIVNPVYTTVFRGVSIRSHEFSWKIAPESPEEHNDIETVLDALRKHSLPPFERSGEINNIMYPDFCTIELTPGIYKFPKPLFVASLAVNHAPEGIPAFFANGKPIGYEIKMRLTEATALVRQDIIEDDSDSQSAQST